MASPVWITESGSLGVVPEGKFYRINLFAEDPDFPGDPTKITYTLISGALPAGVQVNTNGTIEGIPVSVAVTQGVPAEVSADTVSKFAIRGTSTDDPTLIADRTFTLTVSGQDKPVWITPEGHIGDYPEASEINFQFNATDSDPGDVLTITRVTGDIPDGLILSPEGLLSGFTTSLSPAGISQNYEFILRLSDDKDIVLRTFNLNITSQLVRPPYITNNVPDLGRYRHDNYFAHKFNGKDPDSEAIQYEIVSGAVPSPLVLDPSTGWLYGFLPDIGLTEINYEFGVETYRVSDPLVRSSTYETAMSLYGDIDTQVTWITDCDLGIIDNGDVSIFTVVAEHATASLEYRLTSGGYTFIGQPLVDSTVVTVDNSLTVDGANDQGDPVCNKLPQGLTLLPSGNIVGQVSFKTFALDGGTTTFDEEFGTRLFVDPTSFDLTYTFTVEAFNEAEGISVTKEFTILVNKEYDVPHSPIYCKAMPPIADRELIDTLLSNTTVLPESALYRNDDPNFGVAKHIIYNHAYGLAPATASDYLSATEINHYNKNLVLGEIKTARALDADENIIYEVVYSMIIDSLVNEDGESVSSDVDIKYPAIDNGLPVSTVYPNSLANMGSQVIDSIGQASKVLPTWMLSKQEDGTVPGFTPAWVIAYTIPGKAKLLQYNIGEFFGTQLNLIDFEIDRYTLDAGLLEHWEKFTVDADDITADSTVAINAPGAWFPGAETTLDRTDIETPDGPETLIDGGCTQFISPVDVADDTDGKDKYIKFPRTQIINNEQ